MKKLLLICLAIVATDAAHAQGNICLANVNNTDPNPTATRNGLFFLDFGIGPRPIDQDFNVAFYAGTDSGNLTLIRSFSGAAAAGDNFGPGQFLDPTDNCAVIPGATNMVFFRIEAWLGNFNSYSAAVASGTAPVGHSPVFSNPVTDVPSYLAGFSEMPAICIGCTPEPSTFALAHLHWLCWV